ncbi:hypothetical protein LJR129_000659 [Acidovorax sp. LjRoot129]
MSSTDDATASQILQQQLTPPTPLPRLAEQLLGSAIRAYARRSGNLASSLSLRGLKAVDQRLQALMHAARYYGPALLQDLQSLAPKVTRQEEVGFAFVHVALSQMLEVSATDKRRVLAHYGTTFPVAIKDALWFFGNSSTCVALLQDAGLSFVRLGVELAGRMSLPQLLPQVYEAANRGIHTDECLLACARIGHFPENAEGHIKEVLHGHDLARQIPILEVLACIGKSLVHSELHRYIERLTASDGPTEASHPGAWASVVDTAMAIWAARDPQQALNGVIKGLRVPTDTALRVVAVAGHIDGLLPVLAHFDSLDRALNGSEQDVVRLVFGHVPGELSNALGDQTTRRLAMRGLACGVFSANGCAGLKPEHITSWTDASVKERLWALAPIRLRHGQPLKAQHLLDECFDLSHALRRWLYVAHAHQTGYPFALSHEDLAMRQMEAVESLLLLRSLEAEDDAF